MKMKTSGRAFRKWAVRFLAFAVCCGVGFATVDLSKFRAPQVQVINETQALKLVVHEIKDGKTRLEFENVSGKALIGFVLAIPNQGTIEYDTTTGNRVIAPGGTQDVVIPGHISTITILDVRYADWTADETRGNRYDFR